MVKDQIGLVDPHGVDLPIASPFHACGDTRTCKAEYVPLRDKS